MRTPCGANFWNVMAISETEAGQNTDEVQNKCLKLKATAKNPRAVQQGAVFKAHTSWQMGSNPGHFCGIGGSHYKVKRWYVVDGKLGNGKAVYMRWLLNGKPCRNHYDFPTNTGKLPPTCWDVESVQDHVHQCSECRAAYKALLA